MVDGHTEWLPWIPKTDISNGPVVCGTDVQFVLTKPLPDTPVFSQVVFHCLCHTQVVGRESSKQTLVPVDSGHKTGLAGKLVIGDNK